MKKQMLLTLVLILSVFLLVPGCLLAQTPAKAAPAKAAETGKVNINTADAAELDTLPGVGPKIAAAILEWRKQNGRFQKLEDIMAVKGIGEKKFEKMKGLITI